MRRTIPALIVAAALLGGCSSGDGTFTMSGAVWRPIVVPDASFCERGESFQIVVQDENGTVVATGTTGASSRDPQGMCEFSFSVSVPSRSFYRVTAATGQPVELSQAQARAGGIYLKP